MFMIDIPPVHHIEYQVPHTENATACVSIAVTSAMEIMYDPRKPLDYVALHNKVTKDEHKGTTVKDVTKALGVNYEEVDKFDVVHILSTGVPLVISMRWSWMNADFMPTKYELQKYTYATEGTDYTNHAMLIVGYNKKGFIVENTASVIWGNQGKFILPYAAFFDDTQIKSVYKISKNLITKDMK